MMLTLILLILFIVWWIDSDHSGEGWTFVTALYIAAIVIAVVRLITT